MMNLLPRFAVRFFRSLSCEHGWLLINENARAADPSGGWTTCGPREFAVGSSRPSHLGLRLMRSVPPVPASSIPICPAPACRHASKRRAGPPLAHVRCPSPITDLPPFASEETKRGRRTTYRLLMPYWLVGSLSRRPIGSQLKHAYHNGRKVGCIATVRSYVIRCPPTSGRVFFA
ncbi:hypothetical protein BDW60DRAFT_86384 [Aspergillus nidulans var. acristatus]